MKTLTFIRFNLQTTTYATLFCICLSCAAPLSAQKISGGGAHSLVICTDGTVMATGNNNYNQLGNNNLTQTHTPVPINNLTNVVAVAAGHEFSLVLKTDSTVYACGRNSLGQLGKGFSSFGGSGYPTPTQVQMVSPITFQVTTLTEIVSIAAGHDHSLFLKSDGTVWGAGRDDAIGYTSITNTAWAIQLDSLTGIKAVAAGDLHSLFLKDDGTVWACGSNYYGQLGDGTQNHHLTPFKLDSLSGIVSIAAGANHSVFLKNDGTVWICGLKSHLQLGLLNDVFVPTQITSLTGIVEIDAGGDLYWYRKSDGTIVGCGNCSPTPTFGPLSGVVEIDASGSGIFALTNKGIVWGQGANTSGQLGNGTYNNAGSPVAMNTCFSGPVKGVAGRIYNDANQNCIVDWGEVRLPNRHLILNPGGIIVQTDKTGTWHLDSLSAGTYTLIGDTSGIWQPSCPTSQSFTVNAFDSFTAASTVGLYSTRPCTAPYVSATMPRMRPGFNQEKIYINACNQHTANGALNSSYVLVTLDSLMFLQSATKQYTALGNNTYQFNLGTLNPGQCADIVVTCSLSVNAILGTTLCLATNIYPADSCVLDTLPSSTLGSPQCSLPYDESLLKVMGWCFNDSIYFKVVNDPSSIVGDMQCYTAVRIFIDGHYSLLDSVKLSSDSFRIYTFPGDGSTWRMEVDQHPLYPGTSHPSATVEACGSLIGWTPNLVNILPPNDADPNVDIYCGLVTGSYDPNDKTGYPLGVDTPRYIYPNQPLEYVIRFQNTGNDTAFTVVIRDTLESHLDIFSVVSGVSSHSYTFRMYGQRVLEWTFDNILLPDSNTNEEASHGFVTYSVKQNKDLPDGTVINNNAGIYFDFNAPIITNTTTHKVDRRIKELVPVVSGLSADAKQTPGVQVYPNPSRTSFTVQLNNDVPSSKSEFKMYDITGREVLSAKLTSELTRVERGTTASGVYFYRVTQNGQSIANGKLMLQD